MLLFVCEKSIILERIRVFPPSGKKRKIGLCEYIRTRYYWKHMCERESEREKIRETEKETENHLIQKQNIEIKIEILQKRPTTLNTHTSLNDFLPL